ncbi:MAG: hypothetical protein HYU36_16460 [Planctomycetes bacterium]|nr:hypothetical protein [Planctomycetota bacterium]
MVKNTERSFTLETLVDFPDDALTSDFPVTEAHIEAMMATLAQAGIRRVIWAYYGDGHGGYFLPAGIAGGVEDPSLGFDQNQWKAYGQTLDLLGNPLRVAAEAAHRHGLQIYAYFKPYETGISGVLPEGCPQARQWGRLPHIGGFLTWLDPFVLLNPHLRIRRRTDDLTPGIEDATIRAIRLMKGDASPTRIRKENLQIWTSERNYRYQRMPGDFQFLETIEPAPRDFRNIYGELLAARGDPVRTLTLHGLRLDARYILVTTNFTSGPGDFSNAWDALMRPLDERGREIPGVFATGTSIWFQEWEDFARGGLSFDTGRGPETTVLDVPNGISALSIAPENGFAVGRPPAAPNSRGYVAFARGRNRFLPGALCETEPEVQAFWLSCIREMLDAGVDGIELRVENHSTHTDTPDDYGFNETVLRQRPEDGQDLLADVTRVRGRAYTEFLRKAKTLIASRGKRMRLNLNLDWFRPTEQRPRARRLAYPANIDFEWQRWIYEGLLDEAMLRPFATPFAAVFEGDPVAEEMIRACSTRQIPISVNRYVWCNPGLAREFQRARQDGRFNSFVLYETWSYLRFTPQAGCRLYSSPQDPSSHESLALWTRKAETAEYVREVLRLSG